MFEQTPLRELFPAGVATNTAFIARVPLDSGSLVGNWNAHTYAEWAPDSVPHRMFTGDRFAETLERVEALKQLAAPHYSRLAEAAMRYTLSAPMVSTVIPGMKNRAEVDKNVAYSDGAVFPAVLASELPDHLWVRNYYQET
jgi:aryl-alcohol dehydrogenase-like predicted oxidoreductase